MSKYYNISSAFPILAGKLVPPKYQFLTEHEKKKMLKLVSITERRKKGEINVKGIDISGKKRYF